jgi:trimeric autotransporter adhesin
MKSLLCLLFLVFSITTTAQVAINNDNSAPDGSAMLDVKSTNKGMLVPRMTQAQRIAIVSPATGLLVYQTDNPTGFYYNNGTGWFRLSLQNEGWSTTGNAGTNPANNFIGTTDNVAITFKVNNELAGKIDPSSPNNTSLGYQTLNSNTTGNSNTSMGFNSLYTNSTGSGNTAIGTTSLFSNTWGVSNSANGISSLYSNTSGGYNTANGAYSLYSNTNGKYNTAIGFFALQLNNIADANTAVGESALANKTDGDGNTAVGRQAFYLLANGNNNTALGCMAGYSTPNTLNNVTLLGFNAGFITTPDNHINIGNTSNVWIGGQVNWGVYSDKRIKKDIQQNVPGLSFIMKLNPVTYRLDIHKQNEMVYKRGSDTLSWPSKYEIETITQTGFIAQEVEQAAKETNYDFSGVIAPKSEEGLYSIRYAEFVVPLVKAIQEQQTIIDDQNKKIDNLLKQNAQMNARIEKLENK